MSLRLASWEVDSSILVCCGGAVRKPFFWKARKAWFLEISDDDGKLSRVRLGTSRKEAYGQWDRMKGDAGVVAGADMTVIQVIERFTDAFSMDVEMGRRSQSTLTSRLAHLTPFAIHIGESFAAKDLAKHHLTSWLTATPSWNATTQHHAVEAVKRAMSWAVDEGLLEKNPIARVRFEKGDSRDHLICEEEFRKLFFGFKIRRRDAFAFRTILIALRLSGCRPGEIPMVDIENVSDDRWMLPKHKTVRKTKRPRVVYLSPCLQTLTKIAKRKRDSGPLFLSPTGERWEYHDMRRRFHRLRERAEVSGECVMYSFRHTWITNAMLAGLDVATVAEMSGTSIQMIDRHYGHLSKHKDHMVQAAKMVAKAKY